jgi:hypothetical protein
MNKKLIAISIFILIVAVLGYAIYAIFFKPIITPSVSPTPGTTTPSGVLPVAPAGSGQTVAPGEPALPPAGGVNLPLSASPIAQGGLTQTQELSQVPGLAPTLGEDGLSVQFYNKIDGKFYRMDKNGEIESISDRAFHNVDKVTWSPDKNLAVLEYPDGANIIYNFNTNTQTTLPKHWEDFDFSPTGDSLVMKSMGLDPDNRFLAVSNIDGSKARPIESLGENADSVIPSWSPNQQSIALFTEGLDFDRQEVFFVGLNQENFKSMVVEGRGFQPKWSPAGDRLLYSVYSSANDMKPTLWTANAQGEAIGSGRNNLDIDTWADKCAWQNQNEVLCAVPEKLEEGAGLFPELADNTSDRLYKINVDTGMKKLIAIPDNSFNISNLIVSENGYYLFFTDAKTQRIHKIKLK